MPSVRGRVERALADTSITSVLNQKDPIDYPFTLL
jgi:hypothetical protein